MSSDDISESEENSGKYVIDNYNMNNIKNSDWIGGTFWSSELSLKQCVDVLMRLLFLGVTHTTQKLTTKWTQL